LAFKHKGQKEHAKALKDSTPCLVCQFLVAAAERELADNATEAEIVTFFADFCVDVPLVQAQCEAFIDSYGKQLVDFIVQNETPDLACLQIGACGNALHRERHGHKGRHSDKERHGEKEGYEHKERHGEKEGYGHKERHGEKEGYEHKERHGEKEGYKHDGKHMEKEHVVNKGHTESVKDAGCSICELIVVAVEQFIEDNSTESTIEQYLDDLCNALPGSWAAQCTFFVAQELPAIIEWIENEEDPQQFCTQAGYCTGNPDILASAADRAFRKK